MKKIVTNITLLLAAVLLLASAGYAQYAHLILTVNVPFEFNVGEKVFPAGQYKIVRTAPDMLVLRDGHDQFLASVVAGPVQALGEQPDSKLRFEMKDGRHVLSQVWLAGASTGYQLPAAKHLAVLAQHKATSSPGK